MFKLIILFTLFVFTVHAEISTDKIEVTAKSVHTTKDTVYADEGVMVYYNKSIIKSERASYNKQTKLLILDGNVEMVGYKDSKENTSHMEIHTDTQEVSFKKLFLTSENDVWLLSEKAHKVDGKYTLGQSILSSCAVDDPLWHMAFTTSIYDSEENYMKVYNAKVYFGDLPVFYTPYLAFSTNKERSSGLLFPAIGYTEIEGFLYEQPVFWAISPSLDLELNPQIRTERSAGLYATLRFVDSNDSSGKLRVGYFKDNQNYIDEYKPKNEKHYGIEFTYESSKVFKDYLPEGFTDEIYINTKYLNDIDYINLQKSQFSNFGLRALQESRMNYFTYDNDNYFGVNAKYFIDTSKESNDATLQILPSLQWHKYLTQLVWDNLTYSVDTHINNVTRKEGSTYRQAEIRVPFEYTTSFFDDLINVSFSEEFYYSKYLFGNGAYKYDSFQYYYNIHKAKISTDLTKKYDTFVHVLLPSLTYVKLGGENQSPVKFTSLQKTQQEFFSVDQDEERFNFSLSQYFYDKKAKVKFFQRFSQNYYPKREYKLDDLSNEMGYYWEKWSFYNQVTYSNQFSAIRAISSEISLREKKYRFKLGHNYTQKLSKKEKKAITDNIEFSFDYAYNDRISLGGGILFDRIKTENKQWEIRAGYHRDCWSIDASVQKEIRPTSAGSEDPMTYYLQLNFIPFGGIGTDSIK